MPNQLYGRSQDEEDQASQDGQDGALTPAGQTQDAKSVLAKGPSGPGFANLEDIFNLNQSKSKEMAGKQVQQVEGALGKGATFSADRQITGYSQGLQGRAGEGNYSIPRNAFKMPGAGPSAYKVDAVPKTPVAGVTTPLNAYAAIGASAATGNIAQPYSGSTQQTSQNSGFGSTGPQPAPSTGSQGTKEEEDAASQSAPTGSTSQALSSTETRHGLTETGKAQERTSQAQEVADRVAAAAAKSQQDFDAAVEENTTMSAEEARKLGQYSQADDLLDSYNADDGLQLLKNAYKDQGGASEWDAALAGQAGSRASFEDLNSKFQDFDQKYMQDSAAAQKARLDNLAQLKDAAAQGQTDLEMANKQASGFGDVQALLEEADRRRDNGGYNPNEYKYQQAVDAAKQFIAGKDDGSVAWEGLGKQLVEKASAFSVENWDQWGKNYQGELAMQIGKSLGLSNEQAQQMLADFYKDLASQGIEGAKLAIWSMFLTSEAGSETGKSMGNMFGGWGDALHGFTTGTNSKPEEWQAFQEMLRNYMLKQLTVGNKGQRIQ